MSHLKKQIQQLESEIAANNIYLKENIKELESEVPTYAAFVAIGASVLLGFFVARKKSLLTLLRQGTLLFLRSKLWTKKIKRFMP